MRVLLVTTAVLLLSACGQSEPSEPAVSAECLQAMATAEAETRLEESNPLITATLSACSTAEEWLDALRAHPGAMAVKDASFVGDIDLQAACFDHEDTPVCRDAADDGRL